MAEYQAIIEDEDPYGSIIHSIRDILALGLRDEHGLYGKMSEGEHGNLLAIEQFVRAKDNA